MKLAFVIPWYGNIPGGAENECKRTVENLVQRGVNVEVLTTCVKEFLSDWNQNYYEEGTYVVDGITVRRFEVCKRNTELFDRINYKLMSNQYVTKMEEQQFIQEMINSQSLYKYIRNNRDQYDYFVFIPYMFGTTYYGSKIWPEKSIIVPCLHDESYAYMEIYKDMFECISGVIFHTNAEKRIANKLFNLKARNAVLGEGIETDIGYDQVRFKTKYNINYPFVLYAGRRDSGKNVPLLLDYFLKYKATNPGNLKLILIGSGTLDINKKYQEYVVDLGFIYNQDKYDAYSAATLLCQPSINESFSIVIMESWICGTPVLVHGECDVTRDHCVESNGGLFFKDYDEFEECLNFLIKNPVIRNIIGENGRKYVMRNYNWDVIVDRYKSFLAGCDE